MSYTTLLGLYPDHKRKPSVIVKEFHNSWLSAPLIWEFVAKKYMGITDPYGPYPKKGWMQDENLWKQHERADIPKAVRLVHLLTYDRTYVRQKDYARASLDIGTFLNIYDGNPGHWPAIANEFGANPEYTAMGLWCTSVSENPFSGPWNDKKERYDPFDWKTAADIYQYLDDQKES